MVFASEFAQRNFNLKLLMISSTAMFDFASDLFYIGSTPFESETLYIFAIFFASLPTVLFCITNYNRSYVNNHARVIIKTVTVKLYNVVVGNKTWRHSEDLLMVLLGVLRRLIFIPLLLLCYAVTFAFYIIFIILFVAMKGSLHRPSLRLFFQMGGIFNESNWVEVEARPSLDTSNIIENDDTDAEEEDGTALAEKKHINYVFSSSVFAEILFESVPELIITFLNEFVFNSTREDLGLLFVLSLSTSLWSI